MSLPAPVLQTRVPRVTRTNIRFVPNSARVLVRPFNMADPARAAGIISRVLTLSEEEISEQYEQVQRDFQGRHHSMETVFERHFRKVQLWVPDPDQLPRQTCLLIGAYFTSEYALQSAALFNPSIVPHPDQTGLDQGSLRFIISLRATGEGHVSSIEFRSGVVDRDNNISLDPTNGFVAEPERIENPSYETILFRLKLSEMGLENEWTRKIVSTFRDTFTVNELEQRVAELQGSGDLTQDDLRTRERFLWLAKAKHELRFSPSQPLSERIIFPVTSNESNGIEDARFVLFEDEDGDKTYYATYTAYNGKFTVPQLLETKDFLTFEVNPLFGEAAQNKGMALFPRKIKGEYAMLSRQDNENLFFTRSLSVQYWNESDLLMKPTLPWELVQLGNCGSPIETEAGWLVLTHGVGPMRKYCISVILLDLENPAKLIGRLRAPLMTTSENEREGYVPNVVYTCGALLHNGDLIIPYAMADYASSIATVNLNELLDAIEPV